MSPSNLERTIDEVREAGVGVLRRALDPALVAELRHAVVEAAAREVSCGQAWFSHGNQRVFMLLHHGSCFWDLIEAPVALSLVEALLHPQPLLSSITANIARPGNSFQQVHADQDYVEPPWSGPVVLNLAWVLDPFDRATGATRVVRGSHRVGGRPPSDGVPSAAWTTVAAEPGDLVVLDGRVWHGTGENTTEDLDRIAIFANYCAPWIRQQENFSRSLGRDALADRSPRQRELLGQDIWQGLGVVGGLPRSWMGRADRTGPIPPAGDEQ